MTTTNPDTTVKAGIYKGRAVTPGPDGTPHEGGTSSKGTPELLVRLNVHELGRQFTSPLYFSPDAEAYSFDRLRAMGWKGEDLSDLTGIDANEVDVSISYENYTDPTTRVTSPKMRVQIISGGGNFHSSNPMSLREFAASVKATTGKGTTSNSGSVEKPPF